MKSKIFATAIICALSILPVISQKPSIKNGIKAYEAKQYDVAYETFNRSIIAKAKIKPKEYSFIANAAFIAKDYSLAAEYFEKMEGTYTPDDMMAYGRTLMTQEEYELASGMLSQAKSKGNNNPLIAKLIESCKYAQDNPNASKEFEVMDISLESEGPAWGTAFIGDKVVYSHILKAAADKAKPYAYNYTDLVWADWKNNEPGSPDLISSSLKFDMHDGGPSYSASDNKLYFTHMIEYKKNKKKGLIGDITYKIFESTREGTAWSKAEVLPFNSPNFTYACLYPAVSKNGKTLVFASDKAGGIGGFDLYVVYKNGDAWSEPENIIALNTPGDELFPYIAADGSLLFASNGHPGYGELDIFKATNVAKSWKSPMNIGKPFNSARNDFGVTEVPNTDGSFLVSTNRNGDGTKDRIYMVKKVVVAEEPIEQPVVVIDTTKIEPPKDATFETEVILDKGDKLPDDMGLTYKVQIMATKRPIDVKSKLFKGLKIERNMHNNLYKYTVGDYTKMEDAEKYRLTIVKMGFTDAFIVSFAGEYRNKTYIPSDNNTNNPPTEQGKKAKEGSEAQYVTGEGLVYRVQFKSTKTPLDKVNMNIDGQYVFRYEYKGLYRYTIGEYESPGPAIELKARIVKELGYKDAFVVAFNKDNERVINVKIYKK
ncbi:MAG TPA: hypothetical protein DCQ31_18310 [Bacteroidales bacterium]|nr:hypothetical protein [Bacteroidales bacterium]